MYGCSNAVLVYGFNMGDQEYIIDYDYLESVFPDISQYACNIVRNCLVEAIYGISCALDNKTGQAIISDKEKDKVKDLYNKYVEYIKINFDLTFVERIKNIRLGFHLAVSGDYETFQENIILDYDWVKEEEEDDEEEEEEPDDEIEQKTYKGVYYSDAMDMEAAMRADAERSRKLKHMI